MGSTHRVCGEMDAALGMHQLAPHASGKVGTNATEWLGFVFERENRCGRRTRAGRCVSQAWRSRSTRAYDCLCTNQGREVEHIEPRTYTMTVRNKMDARGGSTACGCTLPRRVETIQIGYLLLPDSSPRRSPSWALGLMSEGPRMSTSRKCRHLPIGTHVELCTAVVCGRARSWMHTSP